METGLEGLVPGGSPVARVRFRGRDWFIKRDDLLHPFPGNKGRKLLGLLALDWSGIRQIVSHGGNQSNAMLAVARLARMRGRPFRYYTRPIPAWLRAEPVGNLREALALGMELVETRSAPDPAGFGEDGLFIPQGVADALAEPGLAQLARELAGFVRDQGLAQPTVFLPSGTGATAFFLQRHSPWPVLTVPCVGDAAYLREQFARLGPPPWPRVLEPLPSHPFARPRPEYLALWHELRDATGIEFDLVYDPPGWLALLRNAPPGPVIYVHCGGVEGNATMLARYRRMP